MSMMTVALAQIQRPSFLVLPENARVVTTTVTEKRKDVLECLKKAGGPVGYEYVKSQTGYSKSSAKNILASLREIGLVRRLPGDAVALFEVVEK
jgi:DNA-binding MarR family transcriptional regulator